MLETRCRQDVFAERPGSLVRHRPSCFMVRHWLQLVELDRVAGRDSVPFCFIEIAEETLK